MLDRDAMADALAGLRLAASKLRRAANDAVAWSRGGTVELCPHDVRVVYAALGGGGDEVIRLADELERAIDADPFGDRRRVMEMMADGRADASLILRNSGLRL